MANQEQERNFAEGAYISRQVVGSGKTKGEIIKVNLRWEEFKAWAEANLDSQGFLKLDLKTAKADNSKLYGELNTWVPASQEYNESEEGVETEDDEHELPF